MWYPLLDGVAILLLLRASTNGIIDKYSDWYCSLLQYTLIQCQARLQIRLMTKNKS